LVYCHGRSHDRRGHDVVGSGKCKPGPGWLHHARWGELRAHGILEEPQLDAAPNVPVVARDRIPRLRRSDRSDGVASGGSDQRTNPGGHRLPWVGLLGHRSVEEPHLVVAKIHSR
jgi:hypothetical protein